MAELDDILKEFLVESYENLDQLDRDLVTLESDPTNVETLSSIFRTIHTIKGTCGFLALSKLEAVTHVGENLLGKLRDRQLTLDSQRTTALLTMVDAVREILAHIESDGKEGDGDYSALIETITLLQEGDNGPSATSSAPAAPKKTGSLYNQLGGAAAIQVAVQEFYIRVLADPQLKPFFSNADMKKLKKAQSAFLTQALGGPREYNGADMREAHKGLGIRQIDFEKVAGHLIETLAALGVVRETIEQVVVQIAPIAVEIVEQPSPSQADKKATDAPQSASAEAAASGLHATSVADSSIRVDVGLLDTLMNLVGELVLARNQILQFTTENEGMDTSFNATSQRLNLITTELQAGVMKTRMQPIGNIWSKFPRVVRDLAQNCGKKIRVEMEGKDTDLDKTIIEAIKDPLTHLVRNSADHGIESPDVRTAAGKPAEGRIRLHAFHEGGQVNIEIADDGAGIDPEQIKQKALFSGIITPDQAARMGDREALNLTFLPGFSTAKEVTNISGRGVGMDVVRTNIERIGGNIDLQSTFGVGTTIRIRIPLTLAIIPALVITSSGDRYAIPQISLLELVRIEGEAIKREIEMIHGAPVYRLRGDLLPLVYLDRELGMTGGGSAASSVAPSVASAFGSGLTQSSIGADQTTEGNVGPVNIMVRLEGDEAGKAVQFVNGEPVYEVHGTFAQQVNLIRESGDPAEPGSSLPRSAQSATSGRAEAHGFDQSDDGVNIIVLQADDRQFGLVVDHIHDTEEIVVKPLGKQLKHISTYSGATIMGDGAVALILDIPGLAKRAHVVAEDRQSEERARAEEEAAKQIAEDVNRQTLLIIEVGTDSRMAMPLSLVARLEEFPKTSIEPSNKWDVVQYRGEIMPLIYLAKTFAKATEVNDEAEKIQVVVYTNENRSVGLVVSRIVDIVEESVTVQRENATGGLLGSAVIQEKVTDMLDVRTVVQNFDSSFFEQHETVGVGA